MGMRTEANGDRIVCMIHGQNECYSNGSFCQWRKMSPAEIEAEGKQINLAKAIQASFASI